MVREALRQQVGGQYSPGAGGEDSGPPVVDESAKDVITEADLRDVQAGARFLIREDTIITPAARDLMRERGVEIRYRARSSVAGRRPLIAVGADHGGYEMKERLKECLDELGYRHRDFGTFSEEAVDYPDFAHAVARAVADVEAWAEDETAYAEYERTGEAIPLEAMEDWVRSWGTANELPPPAP